MGEPFKPEYIIPQLVMTSIRNLGKVNTTDGLTDIDGCLYTSTKRNGAFTVGEDKWWNIALPAKSNPKEGLCDALNKMFQIATPTCYAYALINRELESSDYGTYSKGKASNPYTNLLFNSMEEVLKEKLLTTPSTVSHSASRH